MVLFTQESFPRTVEFLARHGLEIRDEDGRRQIPDFVEIFEKIFEKTEDSHTHMVRFSNIFSPFFSFQVIPVFLELLLPFFADSSVAVSVNEYLYHFRPAVWDYRCTKIFTR